MAAPLATSGQGKLATAGTGGVIALLGTFGFQLFEAVAPYMLPAQFIADNVGLMQSSAMLAGMIFGSVGRLIYGMARKSPRAGLVGIALLSWLSFGCAAQLTSTARFEEGEKVCRERVWQFVWGTGETEGVREGCAINAYSTRDTGLSERGAAALKDIADVVSQNLRPGGQLEGGLAERLMRPDGTPVELGVDP